MGPGVDPSSVSDWLRSCLRESVSVLQNRIQKPAIPWYMYTAGLEVCCYQIEFLPRSFEIFPTTVL